VTNTDIGALAAIVNSANPFLGDDERELAHTIYRLLAEGKPVAPADVARSANTDLDRVQRTLDGWTGVYRDDDGRIIGFWGLALPEMEHRFEVDGRTLYTWCAWDPLFIAPLLSTTARVTSKCPVTGETITLVVAPDGVREVDPPTAVLSFLKPTPEMKADVIASFCHYVLLFASAEAAEAWIADNPGTFVLDIDDGFELGRRTLGRLSGERHQENV
jgi:alkylmercury lyase